MTTLALAALLAVQEPIPFERIPNRAGTPGLPVGERVIRDGKEWKAFWTLLVGGLTPPPPAPAVDFASESVLAVVDQVRPSSGYSIEILRIARTREAVVVSFRRTESEKRARLAVLTQPSHVVRAALPAGLPVRFVEEKP